MSPIHARTSCPKGSCRTNTVAGCQCVPLTALAFFSLVTHVFIEVVNFSLVRQNLPGVSPAENHLPCWAPPPLQPARHLQSSTEQVFQCSNHARSCKKETILVFFSSCTSSKIETLNIIESSDQTSSHSTLYSALNMLIK